MLLVVAGGKGSTGVTPFSCPSLLLLVEASVSLMVLAGAEVLVAGGSEGSARPSSPCCPPVDAC